MYAQPRAAFEEPQNWRIQPNVVHPAESLHSQTNEGSVMSNVPCRISEKRLDGIACYYCSTCDVGWPEVHAEGLPSPCERGASWEQIDDIINAQHQQKLRQQQTQKSWWR